jgi:hypothetical protein
VQRLADRRQVDAVVSQGRCFGARDRIVDAPVTKRGFDLRGARIGGNDGIETPRKFYRCLSAAGRAVPGAIASRDETG